MKIRLTCCFCLLVFTLACSHKPKTFDKLNRDNLVHQILSAHPEQFKSVLKNADKHRVQILYTRIDRDQNNVPRFTRHGYRLQTEKYFYPASTVKLPAALLALEKINNLNIPGLTKFTPLKIDSSFTNQTSATVDSTSENNLPSIAHYIKKIFLVSDNDAYNRLYEFLGQQYIMETLVSKGFEHSKLIRRLAISTTPEENRHTNAFTFYNGDQVVYQQPPVENPVEYSISMEEVQQGKAHYRGEKLVRKPIDFSNSNYVSIADLQEFLIAICFPETLPPDRRFNLTEDDYRFLYRYMSMLPRESDYPDYSDTTEYYDSYVKDFLYGGTKTQIPDHIRIFSKSGQSYGYLLDNAYIVDFENKVEFLLTAVIQSNENQIYNDDNYEYKEIGYPFLANLGRVIYEHELKRERAFQPDLSKFDVRNMTQEK